MTLFLQETCGLFASTHSIRALHYNKKNQIRPKIKTYVSISLSQTQTALVHQEMNKKENVHCLEITNLK